MESRFQEIANSFVNMQKKTQKICNASLFSEDDIRHGTFLHVLGVIQPLIIITNILIAFDKDRIPSSIYEPLFGMKKEWASQQFTTLETFAGISLIIEFHFGLEIFLKIILSKMEISVPSKFYQIAEELLGKISIREKEQKLKVLTTLSHIRNVYHSNGIHTNKSTEPIFIQGLKFEFKQGKEPDCVTPKHVCVLIDEIISIMEEITLAKEIKEIKEKIPLQYFPDNVQ